MTITKKKRAAALLLAGLLGISTLLAGCGGQQAQSQPKSTVVLTLWHYYNGAQQESFNQLVEEFNQTVGREAGVLVEAHAHGNVSELTERVTDAVYGKVGAAEVPDIFAAYADTAYELNRAGKVAELSAYMTEEEISAYVPGYLEEGRFDGKGFQIFPVAKSAEVLSVNKTEWDAFAAATGADEGELATWEGIARVAEDYYTWTDSLTPAVAEDGRAFFGRDAYANYIIIGSMQLGTELFAVEDGVVTVQADRDVMRRLWDNYYVPYINGYFAAYGNFRSDDMRSGVVAAFVGSTSGATYFPNEGTREDGSTYPIEGKVYLQPNFEGTEPMVVQQGAGMMVSKSTEERERAAVTFLKWLTQPEQNIRFALASGYLPVTTAANTPEAVSEAAERAGEEMSPVLRQTLDLGVEMAQSYRFYTSKPFESGYSARQVVEKRMQERAVADRAQVVELMAGGMSRAEAVAQFDTDAGFEQFYTDFVAALKAAVDG